MWGTSCKSQHLRGTETNQKVGKGGGGRVRGTKPPSHPPFHCHLYTDTTSPLLPSFPSLSLLPPLPTVARVIVYPHNPKTHTNNAFSCSPSRRPTHSSPSRTAPQRLLPTPRSTSSGCRPRIRMVGSGHNCQCSHLRIVHGYQGHLGCVLILSLPLFLYCTVPFFLSAQQCIFVRW